MLHCVSIYSYNLSSSSLYGFYHSCMNFASFILFNDAKVQCLSFGFIITLYWIIFFIYALFHFETVFFIKKYFSCFFLCFWRLMWSNALSELPAPKVKKWLDKSIYASFYQREIHMFRDTNNIDYFGNILSIII